MSTRQPSGDPNVAAVAGLARAVEALGRRVDDLDALADQVSDLTEILAQVQERLAAIPPGEVPSWLLPRLDGDSADRIEAVATLLGDLSAWLGAVYLRFPDAAQSLPECWLWHPDVVEELLWLRHSWLSAYQAPDASVARVGDWHDRHRPGVTRRIRDSAGTCSVESHRPGGELHRAARPVPLAEARDTVATWWATERDGVPPTAPQHDATARRLQ